MAMFGWMDRLTLRLFLAQAADVAHIPGFLPLRWVVRPRRAQPPDPRADGPRGPRPRSGMFKMAITLIVIYRYRRPMQVQHRWYPPLRTIAISAATASGIVGAGFNLGAIIGSG